MILFIFYFVFIHISTGMNITEHGAISIGLLVARKAPAPGQWQHYQVRFLGGNDISDIESFGKTSPFLKKYVYAFILDTTDA